MKRNVDGKYDLLLFKLTNQDAIEYNLKINGPKG